MRWPRRAPTPPTNVRAVMRDGEEIPLECVYTGRVDGCHAWLATGVLREPPAHMCIDVLPPKTVVALAVRLRGD